MESTLSFGRWVRLRRIALHLTQGELGRQVYCSEIMIRKIEGDERHPSPEIARGLAQQLQLPNDLVPRFLKVARGDLSADHLPLLQNDHERPRYWLPVLSRADLAIPATSFLGRTQEVAQVCELLQQPGPRLLTLVGPPGIGKSRLSLHVAAELSDAFLDGAQFVPLAPLRDPELVPDAIAQIFGFAESAFPTPLDYLRFELRQRHLLLVLDNFEQVLVANRFVQELLALAPQIKVLVTSRVPLGLPEERLYAVPALGMPATSHAPSALAAIRFPAVQLLVSRAHAANPDFSLTTENAGAIAAICARVDGLPLAIELVAARLKSLAPDALLMQLSNRLALSADGAGEIPERHRTLRNAIAWSYELLPPPAQGVFARLGVFVHGAMLEMVQAVCASSGAADSRVEMLLSQLVSHNLVRAETDAPGSTRYTMLETVLEYAHEQLTVNDELAIVRRAHAEVFCDYVEAAASRLHGLERRLWIERIEQDNDNLRAALRWAEESGDVAMLTRLTAALGWFWEMQGRRTEARLWLAKVMASSVAHQPVAARVRVLLMVAHIASEEGDVERSRRFATESLALAEALGDAWTAALARRDLDWVYFTADNDSEGAIALADAAAATLLEVGDLRNYLLTLLDVAMICQFTGDAGRGTPYAQTALHHAQAWHDEPSACEAMSTLGQLTFISGDSERALSLMQECLILAADLPNGKQIAWAHQKYGQMLLDCGESVLAAVHFAESARLWRERNEVLAAAYCQSGEANCLLRQGAVAQATALYETTLEIYRQFDAQRAVAWTLWNLAHAAAVKGDDDRVEPLLVESLALFQARKDGHGIACCEAALCGEWTLPREPNRQ